MGWQLRRGLLEPLAGDVPGSPWWRAVNERLLRDTAEARGHVLGLTGPVSSWSATCCLEYAQQPSARTWYRAHNASIVAAYLDHRELAESETHPERFFINLVLVRVLFAHALVAAPTAGAELAGAPRPRPGRPATRDHKHLRLALAGDAQPLPVDQRPSVVHRQRARFRRILDVGMIQPRLRPCTRGLQPSCRFPASRPRPGRCAHLLVDITDVDHRTRRRARSPASSIGTSPHQDEVRPLSRSRHSSTSGPHRWCNGRRRRHHGWSPSPRHRRECRPPAPP